MVHLAGDSSLLDGPIRPKAPLIGEVQGCLSKEEQAIVRGQALEVLKAYRDGACKLPSPPSIETVHEMMNFVVGTEVPDDYLPMMLEELALDGHDQRLVRLERKLSNAERDDLRIVKLNIDDNQQTAAAYGIMAIPTMLVFRNGQEAARIQGAMPKKRLEAQIEPVLAA